MKKIFYFIAFIFSIITIFLLIFDISGINLFHESAEDSKDYNAFVHSFKIEGSKTFIIEKDTFEIEECWVSHLAYSTTYRFKTEVDKDSYRLNLKLTKSKYFVRKYTDLWGERKNHNYLFKLQFDNKKVVYVINMLRFSGNVDILQLSLDKDSFQDMLYEKNKYICLYKDSLLIKKFYLVN